MKASFGLTAAAAAALLLSACNQTDTASDTVGRVAEDTTTAAGNAAEEVADASDAARAAIGARVGETLTPAQFVERAGVAGLYEVQSAQLAQTKAQSAGVKDLAQAIVRDHQAANERLTTLAKSAGLTAPTTLDERHRDLIEDLQEASGQQFDERFLDQQTKAHEDAVTLFRGFAERGSASPELQKFANETAPKLEQHLQMARALDRSGADEGQGGPSGPTGAPPPG